MSGAIRYTLEIDVTADGQLVVELKPIACGDKLLTFSTSIVSRADSAGLARRILAVQPPGEVTPARLSPDDQIVYRALLRSNAWTARPLTTHAVARLAQISPGRVAWALVHLAAFGLVELSRVDPEPGESELHPALDGRNRVLLVY